MYIYCVYSHFQTNEYPKFSFEIYENFNYSRWFREGGIEERGSSNLSFLSCFCCLHLLGGVVCCFAFVRETLSGKKTKLIIHSPKKLFAPIQLQRSKWIDSSLKYPSARTLMFASTYL